jgi:hypothetical protein
MNFMSFVKEPIYQRIIDLPSDEIFDQISKGILGSGLQVLKINQTKGEVIIRCLTVLFNMVLWRCWGDKILLKCSPLGQRRTEVKALGIPSWFRLGIKKGEKVYSKEELPVILDSLCQDAANLPLQRTADSRR